MKNTLKELVDYLKNPILREDPNTNLQYRLSFFLKLLVICLITSFLIYPIFSILEELQWIDLDTHAMEEMAKNMSKTQLALFVIILAPLLEEIIFRGPLTLFKKPKQFKIAFYILTLLFGYVHITNFEITNNILLLSPILVLPQVLLGGYLGFIRIRFGLHWSILLHAAYNGILFFMSFIFETP